MTWTTALSFAMLVAVWLVCGSEPHLPAAKRGSHGARGAPLVSPAPRRPARLLRHAGRSRGIGRGALEEPSLPPPLRRRGVPVPRAAPPPAPPAPPRISGAPARPKQRPGAPRSPRDMIRDEGTSARSRPLRWPAGSGSPNVLASFAGKSRVWVISAPHASEGYYRLMMSLLKDDVYCELAERHIQQIVLFHRAGDEGGKVRRIGSDGRVREQRLEPGLVPKLMSFLQLEHGKFGMVLLRKTLQVEERYPYPVRLEALYELIDQGPVRRLEKIRQKGFVQKCKASGVEGQVLQEDGSDGGGGAGKQGRAPGPPSRAGRPTAPPAPAPTPTPTPTPRAATPPPAAAPGRPASPTAPPATQRPGTPRAPPSSAAPHGLSPQPRRERPQGARRPGKAGGSESLAAPPPTAPGQGQGQGQGQEHGQGHGQGQGQGQAARARDNRTDRREHGPRGPEGGPAHPKPAKGKAAPKKGQDRTGSNEYESKYDPGRPGASQRDPELRGGDGRAPKAKAREAKKHEKLEKLEKLEKPEKEKRKKLKSEKADKLLKAKKEKAEKKSRQEKEKSKKKKAGKTEQEGYLTPTAQHVAHSPGKSVTHLLGSFEGKRRLLLITAPKAENNMYVQQRDEYLESFCKMATRKISVITIFGPFNNSTMKIDHFQLDNEKPMRVVDDEDLVDQHLIGELRKEYGMTYNDFFMVLTDVDLRVKQYYEVPISMKSVFDLIDTFQSRIKDMEKQKKEGIVCKEDKKQSLENFLSRFRWRRRLLVISAPNDEDWAYSQQLSALSGQACNFGLRHITILKLLGVGEEVGGVLELFPINGSSVVEREDIPAHLVKDIRNYFQVSPEYFSMLLVGKDGNVKSWYPSPMWSMVIVYDLIDSMQLRRQEMAIQQSLGMRCPEDEYAGYGYHSYHQGYQDGYQDDYRHHESYHHGYPY
ncbi:coiled-coil domain-containing protein 80 isoform X1 [Canis lupus familiaris]|nr:coiled-coil domain-containing protein 80 isoform X1 [Canis lupus familiaris]